MTNINPRPILDYRVSLPKGEIVHKLELYRTKNPWYLRPFKGKYETRLLALTGKAIYDITKYV